MFEKYFCCIDIDPRHSIRKQTLENQIQKLINILPTLFLRSSTMSLMFFTSKFHEEVVHPNVLLLIDEDVNILERFSVSQKNKSLYIPAMQEGSF